MATTNERAVVAWLMSLSALLGAVLVILAIAPRVESLPITASVDAGADGCRSLLAAPERDRVVQVAQECTPESGWPCEPSR